MPKAIAICTPVTDYLINLDHIPQPNSFARLNAQSWQFGGNAATAIVTAARQGLDCGIIAPVGDDDMATPRRWTLPATGWTPATCSSARTRPRPL